MAGKKSIMANGTAERMIFNNQDPIPGQMEVNAAGEVKETENQARQKQNAEEQGQKTPVSAKQIRNLINTSTGKPNKTARVNLALDPDTAAALKQAAWEKPQSINAYVEELIKKELGI